MNDSNIVKKEERNNLIKVAENFYLPQILIDDHNKRFQCQELINPNLFEGSLMMVLNKETNEFWFYANEVTKILGYKDTRRTISKHCRHAVVLSKNLLHLLFFGVAQTASLKFNNRGGRVIPEHDFYMKN